MKWVFWLNSPALYPTSPLENMGFFSDFPGTKQYTEISTRPTGILLPGLFKLIA